MSNALAKEGVDPSKTREAWDELQQLNQKYGELAADAALAAGGALPPPFGTAADVISLGKDLDRPKKLLNLLPTFPRTTLQQEMRPNNFPDLCRGA